MMRVIVNAKMILHLQESKQRKNNGLNAVTIGSDCEPEMKYIQNIGSGSSKKLCPDREVE